MICARCGIAVTYLPIAGVYVHAEPRTLANNLHNNTADHDAVVMEGATS